MLGAVLGTLLCWVLSLLVYRQDRRRVRCGALLLLAVVGTAALPARLLGETLPLANPLLLSAALVAGIGVIALGSVLAADALTALLAPERSPVAALLGLAGMALWAAPVAAVDLVALRTPLGVGLGALLGAIALHLGLAFLVFLGASVPYQLLPRQTQTTGIIILGSALVDGEVPPLLRNRLERAATERERLLSAGTDPLLVPSGGLGEEEHRAEGAAMAEYLLREVGVPADRVRAETAARTTEENLLLSHRLLAEAGLEGPASIVTSRFHAFRAALLARHLGLADEALGSRTAVGDLPSATLREFLAILSYRKIWLTVLFLPSLGLVALLVRAATASG